MKRIKRFFKYDNIGILYILPALIYMIVFVGYPIVSNFILSFQEVTVKSLYTSKKQYVGLENYITLFHDNVLQRAIINTFVFTVFSITFQFFFGFLLALFFYKKFKFSKTVRGLLMIPWMIPVTITALMFKFMFSSNVGIINQTLIALHLISKPVEWLTTPGTAMFALIFTNIWIGIPFNMILLSSGLSLIPIELYESASIDGANRAQTLFKITMPLLKPTIQSVIILGFIYTFKVFDLVYVMTKGGPVNSTHVLSTYSYKLSFDLFEFSKGATVANILFIILFIVSLLYLKYSYNDKEDE